MFILTFIKTMFSSIGLFYNKYSLLLKILVVGAISVYTIYNIVSFFKYHNQLIVDNNALKIELIDTKKELANVVKISNDNVKLFEKEKQESQNIIASLQEKQNNDLNITKIHTIYKERTYYEKDSDFIAPVLRNTIDRLFTKK